MASLLGPSQVNAAISYDPTTPQLPRDTHFPAKAKRVIYLHMTGSPPILDLFDYKPKLQEHDNENCPDEYLKGKRFAFTTGVPKLMGTPSAWPSPVAMSASYAPGGLSSAMAMGSAETQKSPPAACTRSDRRWRSST